MVTMNCGHNGYSEIVLQVPVGKLKELFERKAQVLEEEAVSVSREGALNLFDPQVVELTALYNESMVKELRNEAACWKLAAMCLPKDGVMPITLGSLLSIGSSPVRGRPVGLQPAVLMGPASSLKD